MCSKLAWLGYHVYSDHPLECPSYRPSHPGQDSLQIAHWNCRFDLCSVSRASFTQPHIVVIRLTVELLHIWCPRYRESESLQTV